MSSGWVEAKDPSTGKSYYYNRTTKATQWTRPAEMDGPAAPAPPAAAGGDPDEVASNWAQSSDPASGKVYFYNRVTKKTTWTRPACMGPPTASASAGPPPIPAASATPASPALPASSAPAASPPPLPAASAPPADQWAEAKDPSSGRSYWYNRVTKETTWKNPHAATAAASNPAPAPAPAAAAASPSLAPAVAASSPPPPAPLAASSPPALPLSTPAESAGPRKLDLKSLRDDDDDAPANASNGAGGDASGEVEQANAADLFRDDDSEDEGGSGGDRKKLVEDEGAEGHEYRFAKHRKGLLNRVFRTGNIFDESKLLSFKKSLIKKALLKQNRELDDEAVQTFKNIMSYMGDRSSSKPPIEHAKKMLRNLMIAPSGLRDEAYMQLCKQTNNNPKVTSTIKGFELLNFFLATFPPSKNLRAFLTSHLQKHLDNPNSDASVLQLCKLALERLPVILQMGQRKQVPSTVELQCLQELKPVPIKVELCNGAFKTLSVEPYTLVSDVERQMHERFNVTFRLPFALYEAAGANEERILEPSERVLDAIAGWENSVPLMQEVKVEKKAEKAKIYEKQPESAKKAGEAKQVKYDHLVYKAKLVLKTSNADLISDPEAVNLVYVQAVSDVVTERYPVNEKDVTVLAALQMQASFGDYRRDAHVPGWLRPKLAEFMPVRLIEKKPGKVSDTLAAEWEQKILSKYMKVSGFTALEAKLNYLDYVQEWVYYGSTFFVVEQRQFKDYPSPLTMGINCEGVLLMHPEKKTVLEQYLFTDIVTWGHSDEKFIVVVGNIVQQRKLIFKTGDGKAMNNLIHDYVKCKVKAAAAGGGTQIAASAAASPSLF